MGLFSLQLAVCILTLVYVAEQHAKLQQNLRIGQHHQSDLIGDNDHDNSKFIKLNNKDNDKDPNPNPSILERRLSTSNLAGSAIEGMVKSNALTTKRGGGGGGGGGGVRRSFYRRKPPVNPITEIHERRRDGSTIGSGGGGGASSSSSTLYIQQLSKIGDGQGNLKIPMRNNADEIDIENKLHNKMEQRKDNRHKFVGQDDYRLVVDVGLETGTYIMCLLYDDPSYVLLGMLLNFLLL
jgi:hypothetical protein